MTLSKSLYTRAIQCPKALWLKKYKPEVLIPPDAAAQAVFDTGSEVGDLACGLFPGGVEVEFTREYDRMAEATDRLLDEGVGDIYEATFIYDGILVMVDILHVEEDGSVTLYEVKSSTSVKEIYLHDVSIQYYVLANLGLRVKSANVVHLDSEYVRGEELELDKLFCVVDVTVEAEALQGQIPQRLEVFERCLADREHEPDIDIGSHCNKPYECDAKHYCWKVQRNIPDYSIFNIFNLGSKKQKALYEQGITNIADIPEDFEMTARQRQAVENYKAQTVYIDKKAVQAFLDTLTYPVYHLDFETFQQAIPRWKGIRPFMQIPFQYSLHIEHADGRLEHREFLAEEGSDPREALARRLCADIPADVTVLAYNISFEKGVLKALAEEYEDLRDHLLAIADNIKDLMIPFQQKHYVTPEMKGSYSIKYVLPALVPEMAEAYKALDGVHNGSEAMNAFANLDKMDTTEKVKMREALLEYCKLDTLAMVRVLEKLREL